MTSSGLGGKHSSQLLLLWGRGAPLTAAFHTPSRQVLHPLERSHRYNSTGPPVGPCGTPTEGQEA